MGEAAAIVPVREERILFYDDEILAVQAADGEIYLPIRRMCDLLGIGYQGQIDRIRRDPVLAKYEAQLRISHEAGGAQATNCLALRFTPGWLFGINASRVRAEVRAKLIRYQEEVYEVIWKAFREEVAPHPPPTVPAPLDDLAAIEQLGLAIFRLARQQRMMEARLDNVEDTVWEIDERSRREVDDLRGRLSSLELRLSRPSRTTIGEAEAAELSQAVKSVAMELGRRSGRNEFGAIYGELYRRYAITSYRKLPTALFDEAMAWLQGWFREIVATDAPAADRNGEDE